MKKILNMVASTSLVATIGIQVCFSATGSNDENSYIQRNNAAAKASTNKAMYTVYKIRCLTSSGRKALNACNQAIAINPRVVAVNSRKVALSKALRPKKPKRPTVAPAVRQRSKNPPRQVRTRVKPAPVPVRNIQNKPPKRLNVNVRPQPIPAKPIRQENVATPPKIIIQKKTPPKPNPVIVKKIQNILNQLGFETGIADGVAGRKTKEAIKKFQKMTRNKVTQKINSNLLTKFQQAQKSHTRANQKYALAKEQQTEGNLQKSLEIIQKSLKKAPWHASLQLLQSDIKQQIASQKESDENEDIDKIVTALLNDAKDEYSNSNFSKSLKFIEDGLKLSPQNKSFLELEKKIESAQAQEKIRKLIQIAQSHFENDNIKETNTNIEKGLVIDPSNKILLTLKNKTQIKADKILKLSTLIARVQIKINNAEFDNAISLVDEGLILSPNHKDLLGFKEKILRKKDDVAETQRREQKVSRLLTLIEEKQNKLSILDNKILMPRQILLDEAQQTLERYWSN